jgi:hypothetical protein
VSRLVSSDTKRFKKILHTPKLLKQLCGDYVEVGFLLLINCASVAILWRTRATRERERDEEERERDSPFRIKNELFGSETNNIFAVGHIPHVMKVVVNHMDPIDVNAGLPGMVGCLTVNIESVSCHVCSHIHGNDLLLFSGQQNHPPMPENDRNPANEGAFLQAFMLSPPLPKKSSLIDSCAHSVTRSRTR